MKKITVYIIMLCLLFLLSGCGNPKEEAESILKEDVVLDLGSHMIAYYMPREEIDTAYTWHGYEKFQGDRYIALRDLDHDAVWYLPDVYGKILGMEAGKRTGLSLQYIPDGAGTMQEVCVPICFFERQRGEVMDFDPFCNGEKSIFGTQEGLKAGEDVLPQKVWEETFCMEGEEYTILFERVSPIYNPGYESGEIEADYCLTVLGAGEDILSRQMIFHYPVAYEEACWVIDFSGDGFLDVAFCTEVYRGGKNGSWSSLKILIWNEARSCYEEKGVDKRADMPLWNEDMAALVICAETRDNIYCAKEMYAWVDGQWQRTRRLERVYSETEFYDMPGEGERPYTDGYRELVYLDGELVEENRIEEDFYEEDAFWFEEECGWSANYKGGIRLYPDWPEWEKVETAVGGIIIDKYNRGVGDTD